MLTVFVLPIEYKGVNGARDTVRRPLFMISQHLLEIILFADGVPIVWLARPSLSAQTWKARMGRDGLSYIAISSHLAA